MKEVLCLCLATSINLLKDQLATRSGGVNLLRDAHELDAPPLEILEQFDQMLQ